MPHYGAGQPWVLGLLAGGTIFLGLPVARLRAVSSKVKAALNAVSTGILIFLLVEIAGHVLEQIEESIQQAAAGVGTFGAVLQSGGLLIVGFSLGLLSLVYFEQRYLGTAKDAPPQRRSQHVAMMIAVGLGLHNLTEGLAIGQGYAGGAMQLAWLLAIGFALHNATEGFGIAAPLSGHRVNWRFLFWAGLIAGGPTVVGAVLGGWWSNKPTEMFCLALAAGTILYVVGELLHLGRQLKGETVVEIGLLVGFFMAAATDFFLVGAMSHEAERLRGHQTTESVYFVPDVGEHGPRHGGIFGDADDLYHYELVLDPPHQLRLYVNDEHNRPLNVQRLRGRWRLDPDGPSPVAGRFAPSVDGGYFSAILPQAHADLVHVEVSVQKGDLWATMEFYLPTPAQSATVAPASHR